MKNEEKKIIGFQIKSSDGKEKYPEDWFSSRDVIATEKLAIKWMENHSPGGPSAWKMVPIYDGDIKEPKMWYNF